MVRITDLRFWVRGLGFVTFCWVGVRELRSSYLRKLYYLRHTHFTRKLLQVP